MKKKILAAVCCASMIGCLAATPVLADETVKADGDYKIALITMDSVDQHWVSLKEGAEEEAKADGVTVDFMAPDVKDDAKQIECINNAVAGGYDAILVAANSEDAVSGALQEAVDAGIKIVYVDSPANVEAEASFSTDNKAAGKTAGEEMIKALEDKGNKDGSIGIVNINTSTNSTIQREEGFREALEGTDYELLETQYCEGDAAKAQTIAENYITEGVVGIFGANEGAATGTGNAIKFDCITSSSSSTFVCTKDTYNTFCDIVLSYCLSFCSITFTVLCFKKFIICSFKSFSESFFTLDSRICGSINIYDTDASIFISFVFQSFDHFFTSCFTSSFVICGE